MLTIERGDQDIIYVRASGKLTKPDYDRFREEFEKLARIEGPMRVLIDLKDFERWEIGGLWEDMKFDIAHHDDPGCVAVVGEREWEDWATRLAKPFFKAEMRYFERARAGEAREWLTGGEGASD